MDEMIRTMLSEPPPSAAATADARRRLTDEIAGRRSHRSAWRWSLAGSGVAAVAAAGVALALAAGSTGTAGLGRPGGGTGATGVAAPPAADATAPQLLLAAAEQAAKPAGTGRYWRVLTVGGGSLFIKVRAGDETFMVTRRWATESWTPRNAKDQAWLGRQDLGARPRTAADEAAWRRAGSPTTFDLGPGDTADHRHVILSTKPSKGALTKVDPARDYEDGFDPLGLAALPADPDALEAAARTMLRRHGVEKDDSALFSLLQTLLVNAPAGPALRSAAFTVLSRLPDVRNAGPREDASGRTGVALELMQTSGDFTSRNWLILDPHSYTLLGFGMRGGDTVKGGKEADNAILKAEWTDRKPAAPTLR